MYVEWEPLRGLADNEARALLQMGKRRRFARNEVVFHRGDPAETLHVIRSGTFLVQATTPLGDTGILQILGRGQSFGEVALLSSAPRSATVLALERSETLSLHQRDFDRLRREHRAATDVLLGLIVEDVRRLSDRLIEALYIPAEKRVLRRLADVADFYAKEGEPGEVPLTQEQIASFAGTSRATVNRVLREEERRGTLELHRGTTVVLDAEKLKQRAR